MNKNYTLIVILVFSLVSCTGNKKIKNIVDFTPKLTSEISESIVLSGENRDTDFSDAINFFNRNNQPLLLSAIDSQNIRKVNVSKANLACAPIIHKDVLYILDTTGHLSAISLLNNYQKHWSISIRLGEGKITSASVLYKNNKLYIVANRELIIIDASSGQEVIRKSLDDLVKNQPIVIGNILLIQTVSNELQAFDANNWRLLWTHETWPEVLSTSVQTSPISINNKVIAGYTSGQLVAIDLATGRELWQFNLAREGKEALGFAPVNLACQPLVDNDFIYIAGNNNYLIKIHESGKIIWKRELADIQSMSKAGNVIFITTNGRQLAALSAQNGKIIWVSDLNDAKNLPSSKTTFFFAPIVTKDLIILISKDGVIYELKTHTGEIVRQVVVSTNIDHFIIYNNSLLFIEKNKLFYFK